MSSRPPRQSAIAELRLDGAREIALKAAPPAVRPALRALWDIDLTFADVLFTTVTPQLGAIRLAWWRERLEDLDKGIGPPAEPRLQAVAATLIPAGVTGAQLSGLEDCWFALLSPSPWGDDQADAIAQRGAILFTIAARLLGIEPAAAEPLGRVWSLAEAAQYVGDEDFRDILRNRAKSALAALPRRRIPANLYPLAMIAARSVHDLLYSKRGALHRFGAALRYSLLGAFPGIR